MTAVWPTVLVCKTDDFLQQAEKTSEQGNNVTLKNKLLVGDMFLYFSMNNIYIHIETIIINDFFDLV